MSTIRDVADRAGVSAKTVSRVMNSDRYVSDQVRNRVLRAVDELQYVPNAMAKTFRSGRDNAIGVAVPTLNDMFAPIVQAVEEIARARGSAMYLTCLGDDPDLEQATLTTLLSRHLSGLIVSPIAADQSYLQPWLNHTAMVFIDRQPHKLAAASVVHDDIAGATAAIRHLIEHGHRRIAFVGDSLNVASTARRMRGYETTVLDSGVAVEASLVMFGADTSSVVPGLLALSEPPTAIFSANPSCSVPVSRQLHAAGRTDIPLVSFGDFPLADVLNPPVSAIDQDPSELGRIAAERLFQRIDTPDKRLRRQTIVPVTLVARGCCERPRHTGRTASHAGSPGAS